MDFLILNYLNNNYTVSNGHITIKHLILSNDTIIYPYELISEVKEFFNLNEEYTKNVLIEWVKSIDNDFDLNLFNSYLGFPMARKIAAKTIGLDLVSVQPISEPLGQLVYLDFTYSGE